MDKLKRRKVLAGILIIIFVSSAIVAIVMQYPELFRIFGDDERNNFVPSVITAELPYNVTYANITYGTNTTTIWETGGMNITDGTNASFLETRYNGVADTLMGDTYTDAITGWIEEYRFKNLETVADAAIGATSIRAQFAANNGFPIIAFDNNTSYSMNLDTSEMDDFNVSVKGSASGSELFYLSFHNTNASYYYVPLNQSVTTSWATISVSRAQAVSVGGMTATDSINWIEFVYAESQANRWMYIDSPVFYNTTAELRLSVSFNFTGIAAYDHYTLNVSAASNVTIEYMQISEDSAVGAFLEPAVYNIEDNTWNNFTILLNTTIVVTNTYFVVFINSTALEDSYNSTLDIDLMQLYAWNETNVFPVVNEAVIVNPDDVTRLYAGYRNYTITLNMTDEDGFADIHYARIGFENPIGSYHCKFGFFEDNNTFVEELYPANITLQIAGCSAVKNVNNLNLTFSVMVEVNHTSVADLLLSCFVNDTQGASSHPDYAFGYHIEVDAIINGTLSDDRGNGGATIYASGTAYYFNSTIGLASGYYDVWAYNTMGYTNYSDATIVAGAFNITIVATTDITEVDYEMSVRAEGGATTDIDYSAVDSEDSYISDRVQVYFTRTTLDPSSEEVVYIRPVIYREYDNSNVTNYDMVITRDGVVWKSFDEANVSANFWDADSAETHTYDVNSITDNTYVITDFDSIPMIVIWYGGHGGVGDDEDDDDAWFDLDDWFPGLAEEDPFLLFIMFLILFLILIGCIVCPACTRLCCRTRDPRMNPLINGRGRIIEYPYPPFMLLGKKKKKKKKKPKRKKKDDDDKK